MSHGGGDSGVVDPNLTPLLDLVLQLLMFFIICVNFVGEQVSSEVRLPTSESAKAIEKADPQTQFVNIKSMRSRVYVEKLTPQQLEQVKGAEAVVLLPGVGDPLTFAQARHELKKKYEDAKFLAEKSAADSKDAAEVKTVINLRADGDLEYEHLHRMMTICKEIGYKRLKIRALIWDPQ